MTEWSNSNNKAFQSRVFFTGSQNRGWNHWTEEYLKLDSTWSSYNINMLLMSNYITNGDDFLQNTRLL